MPQMDCERCGLRWLEEPRGHWPEGEPYPQYGTCPRCTWKPGDVIESHSHKVPQPGDE